MRNIFNEKKRSEIFLALGQEFAGTFEFDHDLDSRDELQYFAVQ